MDIDKNKQFLQSRESLQVPARDLGVAATERAVTVAERATENNNERV